MYYGYLPVRSPRVQTNPTNNTSTLCEIMFDTNLIVGFNSDYHCDPMTPTTFVYINLYHKLKAWDLFVNFSMDEYIYSDYLKNCNRFIRSNSIFRILDLLHVLTKITIYNLDKCGKVFTYKRKTWTTNIVSSLEIKLLVNYYYCKSKLNEHEFIQIQMD